MAITLNDNIQINARKPVKNTDLFGSGQKYATKEDIPSTVRYEWMETTDVATGLKWTLRGGIADANWTLAPTATSPYVYIGKWFVCKKPGNTDYTIIQTGDIVRGFWDSNDFWMEARYLGGGDTVKTNFEIINNIT